MSYMAATWGRSREIPVTLSVMRMVGVTSWTTAPVSLRVRWTCRWWFAIMPWSASVDVIMLLAILGGAVMLASPLMALCGAIGAPLIITSPDVAIMPVPGIIISSVGPIVSTTVYTGVSTTRMTGGAI